MRFEEIHINSDGLGGRIELFSGLNTATSEDGTIIDSNMKDRPKYSMGVNKDGDFSISLQEQELLSITDTGRLVSNSHLFAPSFITTNLVVNGIPQWKMIRSEVFPYDGIPKTWLYDNALHCNGLNILTTSSSKKSVATAYENIPAHTQLRIVATVHFIDDWQGETAFLKINDHYMWTMGHDQQNTKHQINVCGNKVYPESQFTMSIDIAFWNTDPKLSILFGCNLEEGAEAYFGVSSVNLYSRAFVPPYNSITETKK